MSEYTVIEVIQLVERIASVLQFGEWVTEHGDRAELSSSDKRALECLRGDLNDLQHKVAETLSDEQHCGSAAAIGEGAGVKAESRRTGGATGAQPPIATHEHFCTDINLDTGKCRECGKEQEPTYCEECKGCHVGPCYGYGTGDDHG